MQKYTGKSLMRIGLTTRYPHEACSIFYWQGLANSGIVHRCRLDDLHNYDIALFMSYPGDIDDFVAFKRKYPKIPCGLIDPKDSVIFSHIDRIDFFVVDSIEMRDYWAGTDVPIFEYVEYPQLPQLKRHHDQNIPIIIGYHGNLIHLNCMGTTVSPALEDLAKCYPLELWVIYNFHQQGRWSHCIPKGITVRHINWYDGVYTNELTKVDIGIVPGFIPIHSRPATVGRQLEPDYHDKPTFHFRNNDYLLRFKMSSNPGRIIVWGKLGIPVVADFFPSAMRCITDGKNGLLACSQGGWHVALERLIRSSFLRQQYADAMCEYISEVYDFNMQNCRLLNFLREHVLEGY